MEHIQFLQQLYEVVFALVAKSQKQIESLLSRELLLAFGMWLSVWSFLTPLMFELLVLKRRQKEQKVKYSLHQVIP